ncbi:NAD(P)H-binding protein [Cyclobacterium qasimii]|uniref:NAD-dependent epimerase/dehydratase n=2 Tax=Cyclobacterium qasimii TaxID=1350429 RepID=S7VH80_9BACT|nr:NAD(P)H-binding protein [Cyclobacterium qasimii]EPR68892.1 NAD-dependent epimerase/dehydratase [Cyclobacterium qasimii M12-11B]GEO22554.1 NAD(P)-dependent oxidoreductase [Cyclobacterium qasimii]
MTISIIGLGWLGIPLAEAFQQIGVNVKGTTTSLGKKHSLEQQGIVCEVLNLTPELSGPAPKNIFDTDILFINIPPSTRTKPSGHHPRQIEIIKALAMEHGIKKIIYISATSVYPTNNQVAKESDTLDLNNTGNQALFNAEQILQKDKTYDLTIVRFGGLLGDDRIPGKYFSGKENVSGDVPVNYIHRQDAVKSILWLVEHNLWNETYNIVSPEHPIKREVFEKNAADVGFPPPATYATEGSQTWKEISSEKWCKTNFQFIHDNPLSFTYSESKP